MTARCERESVVPAGIVTTASWFPANGFSVNTSRVQKGSVFGTADIVRGERWHRRDTKYSGPGIYERLALRIEWGDWV